ncbi:hypothetical protein K6T82_13355 [Flavobacterium sp. 17A]|uniref:Uncharacterized protein n=1 Tax=Flavobacterium potami TaxID=2872310 RepID=A0A9X1HBK7_9FLAO|nr:hypothetical protein [Flavobacterium potami]MBZ4035761.1 hypothetical protein [Flavobacterium potami]
MESSNWNLQIGIFKLESSNWNLQIGIFKLESSNWDLQIGIFKSNLQIEMFHVKHFKLPF